MTRDLLLPISRSMDLPGDSTRRFEIQRQIGKGSFGAVYEALDRQRNRVVALKVLRQVSPEALTRFKREFRSVAELRHQNLAGMYELLVLGEEWVLSMELIRGSDLLEHLAFVELQHSFGGDADDTLDLKRSSRVSEIYLGHLRDAFRQLATAIAVLHGAGVVHRDIKPSNVMITPEGRVVLLDFGLATVRSGEDTFERGIVAGTPGYMAPEQLRADRAGPESDWYAFGVILFQALTGKLPFEALEVQAKTDGPSPRSIVPAVPVDLASLTVDLLRVDPRLRPSDDQILRRLGVSDGLRVERSRPRTKNLIGRGRELRKISGWLTSKRADDVRLILLHGSPGVGKTAMADKLLDDLRRRGDVQILAGRCGAWESVPFNAVDTIVDSLARAIRQEKNPAVEEVLGHSVAATHLFPVLGSVTTSLDDETVVVPRSGRRLIARAATELRALMIALAGDRPVVMFLDDAQWGDYQSAEMFRQILSSPAPGRVTLVATYRTEDWRTSLLLQALINSDLPRHELELKPLSARMIATLKGKADSMRLHKETAGNVALAEMLLESGRRVTLRDAVDWRLARLSAPARRLFAMVVASPLPIEEGEAERQLQLFEIDEPLRTLVRDRLIRSRRTGNLHEIDVYHPRIREVARLIDAR